MAKYGIVVDLNRCVGCMTCVINCKHENLTRPGVWWNQILEVESLEKNRIVYVRYACMHCEDPPCAKACPNQAIEQRADGIVLVDKGKCAGAGACVEACPYGVIIITPGEEYFAGEKAPYEGSDAHRIHEKGKASMCTLCYHRIDQGKEPACVAGCPSKAMIFGDLDDPTSTISQKRQTAAPMKADAGSGPKVLYVYPDGLQAFVEEEVGKNPHMVR